MEKNRLPKSIILLLFFYLSIGSQTANSQDFKQIYNFQQQGSSNVLMRHLANWDNDHYLTMALVDTNSNISDFYATIMKVNMDGDTVWTKSYAPHDSLQYEAYAWPRVERFNKRIVMSQVERDSSSSTFFYLDSLGNTL
ncbi:MAG: hypothetical protein MRY83_04140, partial [Flavobacteriales bacterium]|nr:hypothetical protein [Flavobacteriales bacterium]